MSEPGANERRGITLLVRRVIAASPERLFRAWTDAVEFVRWWGPRGVVCESVEIDLRIGGAYRIANRLPDGRLIWITGAFEAIEPPHRLVYTWRAEPGLPDETRVVVSFTTRGEMTEVLVAHERLASTQERDDHERGWIGCLDGLAQYAG